MFRFWYNSHGRRTVGNNAQRKYCTAKADREIVGGLVGRFSEIWSGDFGLLEVAGPVEFLGCNPPNTANLVIGFSVEPAGEATLLTTETRVDCPDRYSLLMFAPIG